jgi:hypothetical protein
MKTLRCAKARQFLIKIRRLFTDGFFIQYNFYLFQQRRNFILDHIPYDFIANTKIVVRNDVSKIPDFAPFDLWMTGFGFVRYMFGRLTFSQHSCISAR